MKLWSRFYGSASTFNNQKSNSQSENSKSLIYFISTLYLFRYTLFTTEVILDTSYNGITQKNKMKHFNVVKHDTQ